MDEQATLNFLAELPADELARAIQDARNLDLVTLTNQEIFDKVAKIATGYRTFHLSVGMDFTFRMRLNIGHTLFGNVRELWYPPNARVGWGRFNPPGVPVLYFSDRLNGALLESKASVGDFVTLLIIRASRTVRCAHIGMSRCFQSHLPESFSGVLNRNFEERREKYERLGIWSKWLAIDDYFADVVTASCPPGEEQHFYKTSNMLSAMLFGAEGTEGIVYPGVATRQKSLNFCVMKEHADSILLPVEAWAISITDWQHLLHGAPVSDIGYFKMKFLWRSGPIAPDGKLNWRPVDGYDMPSYLWGEPLPFEL